MTVRVRVHTKLGNVTPRIAAGIEAGLTAGCLEVIKTAKGNAWPPGSPVDTGVLRSSIGFKVTPRVAQVFAKKDYAAFVEFGTSKMPARPFLRLSIEENRQKINHLLREALRAIG